jgi:DNA polymerase-2
MTELTGWLLDVYACGDGVALWLLGEDGCRYCLRQAFPAAFYAAGRPDELRSLWKWLSAQPESVRLARTERRDLFSGPTVVLMAEVRSPAALGGLFQRTAAAFPSLTYYDADLHLGLRYLAACGAFPLARLRVVEHAGRVQAIQPLDEQWELDPEPPPLRKASLEPDCDPFHADPEAVIFTTPAGKSCRLTFEYPRGLMVNLRALLERFDPDLLLTAYGDTWLLPRLLEISRQTGLPLPLNRDPDSPIRHKQARSYHAYGQVIYRGQQVLLAGRWHIDANNAVMYQDYGVQGILEISRVTGLPVQVTARTSPGTGISAMQVVQALRMGVMVPWRKQQAETLTTVTDLVRSDFGGLVYQPTVGLHEHVAEVDFVSMYPSIMREFNISPETVVPGLHDPKTGLPVTRDELGLVPLTLDPLLKKRVAMKAAMMVLPKWDPRWKRYKDCTSAYKWLLVTCFGYLGYKNARFGKIESHAAVCAYGREALLRAKEAAEDLGFSVTHLYVDGAWLKKPGLRIPQDCQPLLDEILARSGLPIGLDGIYKWVAFLPSRVDERVPVPNRYFGVFQSGEIKARGIELRRRDTPAFIKETQQRMLEILSHAPDACTIPEALDQVRRCVRRRLADLRAGRVPLEKLVVRQTLSREVEKYKTPSPAGMAAAQLKAIGKELRPGQSVRLLFMRGSVKARAWDLPGPIDPRAVDLAEYRKLLLRAVDTILQPFQAHLWPERAQRPLPFP